MFLGSDRPLSKSFKETHTITNVSWRKLMDKPKYNIYNTLAADGLLLYRVLTKTL